MCAQTWKHVCLKVLWQLRVLERLVFGYVSTFLDFAQYLHELTVSLCCSQSPIIKMELHGLRLQIGRV